MTPFEISIALHYATAPGDFRNGDFRAPILAETFAKFVEAGLLIDHGEGDGEKAPGQRYEGTRGLKFYVDALCGVPFPVQAWVMPPHSTVPVPVRASISELEVLLKEPDTPVWINPDGSVTRLNGIR